LKAHTQIDGEKVNVSYAFAKAEKQAKPIATDSNKNQEKQSPENPNKKQQPKSGLTSNFILLIFYFILF
jgi:hypothetical protein